MAGPADVRANLQAIHARMMAAQKLTTVHARVTGSDSQIPQNGTDNSVLDNSLEARRAIALGARVVAALRNLGYSDRMIVAGVEGEDIPDLTDEPIVAAADDGEFAFTDDEVVNATMATLKAMGEEVVDSGSSVDDLVTGGELGEDDLNGLSDVLQGFVDNAHTGHARIQLLARLSAATNCLILKSAKAGGE